MKHTRVIPLALLVLLSCPALAEVDGAAVLGGAIGGGAGAAVGSAVGGRTGAIVGGAVGGAAGAAIATDRPKERTVVQKEVIVEKEVVYVKPKRHDNGLHLGHRKGKHRDD
ncbi:MAG: hypothetical protein KatS3mg123_2613 [Burkholderiales bacterium]|nr:MAG: hypothetical protein KatS3mg123_2613 [Burkholderiales bacterium]